METELESTLELKQKRRTECGQISVVVPAWF